jgi:hypothetical protein
MTKKSLLTHLSGDSEASGYGTLAIYLCSQPILKESKDVVSKVCDRKACDIAKIKDFSVGSRRNMPHHFPKRENQNSVLFSTMFVMQSLESGEDIDAV